MEDMSKGIQGKVRLLQFTLGKSEEILNTGSALLITRHRDALNTIVQSIEQLKLQVVEEMFNNDKSEEEISFGLQLSRDAQMTFKSKKN